MSPYDWKVDAAQARADREAALDAALNPTCARCGDHGWIGSPELGVDLCVECHDAFIAWDRVNPTAPYDDFLAVGFVDAEEPVLVGAAAGRMLVGVALLVLAVVLVAVGVWVALTAPPLSGGNLIAGPALILAGGAIVAFLFTPVGEDR